jgi:hypothetical protein
MYGARSQMTKARAHMVTDRGSLRRRIKMSDLASRYRNVGIATSSECPGIFTLCLGFAEKGIRTLQYSRKCGTGQVDRAA